MKLNLSIGERRTIGNQAAGDPAFRALLRAKPHEAVQQVTGRALEETIAVDVVEEGKEWGFVMVGAEAIELDLPDPVDARSAVENGAYALLRDNPALREEMAHDPIAFAREWLGIDLQDESVLLHDETPDALVVLIPNRDQREELDDLMMDLVAGGDQVTGGGQQGSNLAKVTQAPRTPAS